MTDKGKKVQEEIKESAHKVWLAGLGALAAAEEEGAKVFNTLVERGEKYESRGKEELAKVKEKVEGAFGKAEGSWEKLGDSFDDKVAGVIQKLGVPTSDEITTLTQKVEELTKQVDQLKVGTAKAK